MFEFFGLLEIKIYSIKALTWIFGFLVTIPGNSDWIYMKFAYALIFCLLNSTQGFQIFVVYILISRSRGKILKKKIKMVNILLKKKTKKKIRNIKVEPSKI